MLLRASRHHTRELRTKVTTVEQQLSYEPKETAELRARVKVQEAQLGKLKGRRHAIYDDMDEASNFIYDRLNALENGNALIAYYEKVKATLERRINIMLHIAEHHVIPSSKWLHGWHDAHVGSEVLHSLHTLSEVAQNSSLGGGVVASIVSGLGTISPICVLVALASGCITYISGHQLIHEAEIITKVFRGKESKDIETIIRFFSLRYLEELKDVFHGQVPTVNHKLHKFIDTSFQDESALGNKQSQSMDSLLVLVAEALAQLKKAHLEEGLSHEKLLETANKLAIESAKPFLNPADYPSAVFSASELRFTRTRVFKRKNLIHALKARDVINGDFKVLPENRKSIVDISLCFTLVQQKLHSSLLKNFSAFIGRSWLYNYLINSKDLNSQQTELVRKFVNRASYIIYFTEDALRRRYEAMDMEAHTEVNIIDLILMNYAQSLMQSLQQVAAVQPHIDAIGDINNTAAQLLFYIPSSKNDEDAITITSKFKNNESVLAEFEHSLVMKKVQEGKLEFCHARLKLCELLQRAKSSLERNLVRAHANFCFDNNPAFMVDTRGENIPSEMIDRLFSNVCEDTQLGVEPLIINKQSAADMSECSVEAKFGIN